MEGQEAPQFIFKPEILSHDSLFPSDETESLYYHEAIILKSTSRLTLDYADDPALDMFEDSFALFLENRGRPFAKGLLKAFHPESLIKIGFINVPNYGGRVWFEGQSQSLLLKTLLVATAQLGLSYDHLFYLAPDLAFRFGVRDDIFVRGAYNLYDLSPSIIGLREGWTLSQVLARTTSGSSFSTLQNYTSFEFALGNERRSLRLSWSFLVTDFLYSDHLLDITFSPNELISLGLAYDFASYDTLNGIQRDCIIPRISLSNSSSSFGIEGQYRMDGELNLSVFGSISIGKRKREIETVSLADGELKSKSEAFKTRSNSAVVSPSSREVPEEIIGEIMRVCVYGLTEEWNDELLEKDDLTLVEIGAVLVENKISERYDYDRITDLDFGGMRSPEEYIEKGGICVDAANTTANLLKNNGYESKIVFSKQVEGPPHAFVVTEDTDGSFYLFNYEYIYSCPEAGSFQEASASYSKFLVLCLLDPRTHRVTDIVTTADSNYLERIAGIE